MKGYRLQVLGYSLIFLLLSTVTCTLYPTFAAESSPSADIKAKLEELKKEIASKAAKLKQEVNNKLKDKAYIGRVKTKSDSSLTLAATSGPKIVSINQDTLFEGKIKSRSKFSQKNILEEDFIVALGDIDEQAVLIAKKVILLPTTNSQQHTTPSGLKTHLWGQVIGISDKLVTIKNRDNEQVRAFGTKNIAISPPTTSTVKLNDFVILTGVINEQSSALDKNSIFDAEFVYIIPQGGFIKPKKIATPSAKVATPSAEQSSRTSSTKPKAPTR